MTWIFFALLAPAVFATVVFVDKYILQKFIKDYQCMPIYSAIMGLVGGTVIWIIAGFPVLSNRDALLVLLTGVLSLFSFVMYFKAISYEEASIVNLLFYMFPIFVLILSSLFLKESLTIKQFIGFVLILIATLGVSYESEKNSKKKFVFSPAFFLILGYDFILAITAIIMKFVIDANSFSKTISYQSWGMAIGGLTIYLFSPSIRKSFQKSLRVIHPIGIGMILGNEGLFILGRLLTYFAFSIGPIILVSVLESTSVFFGFLLGVILTNIAPSVFKENISRRGLIKKILFGSVLITGIWMVYTI